MNYCVILALRWPYCGLQSTKCYPVENEQIKLLGLRNCDI
jgi:hypothetical protein